MLSRLELTAIRDQLDTRLDEAARRELTLREALALFCQREVARKDERRIDMATKVAHFPTLRDLDGFDFAAQPSLDRSQIRELAACRWVAHGDALLLLGPPGGLVKAHAEGRLEERLAFFAKPKLLIVDELGYLPFEPSAAHLFFQLVSRRYERGSMLITSNRSVGEWGTVFGDSSSPPPSSTGCFTTATSSPSVATAIACARSVVRVLSSPPHLVRKRSHRDANPSPRPPPRGSSTGVRRYLPRAATPAAWRALRGARGPSYGLRG
jgi:hypothetical protein